MQIVHDDSYPAFDAMHIFECTSRHATRQSHSISCFKLSQNGQNPAILIDRFDLPH